jgi:hypothetical protein
MMKKIQISLLALAAIALTFAACKKDDPIDLGQTPTIIQAGTWRITQFNEDGSDHTSHFTGYSFTFSNGGVVTATKDTSTVTGTWSTGTDDSTPKFNLAFTATQFEELSDDWHIKTQADSKIELEDVSGGNGGTDLLTFEKN